LALFSKWCRALTDRSVKRNHDGWAAACYYAAVDHQRGGTGIEAGRIRTSRSEVVVFSNSTDHQSVQLIFEFYGYGIADD